MYPQVSSCTALLAGCPAAAHCVAGQPAAAASDATAWDHHTTNSQTLQPTHCQYGDASPRTVELARGGRGLQDSAPHLLRADARRQRDVGTRRVGEEALQVLVQLVQLALSQDGCVEHCGQREAAGEGGDEREVMQSGVVEHTAGSIGAAATTATTV